MYPSLSCSLSLPAFLLGVAPGLSISIDNNMLLNYVYVMNNNNSSFTLEITDYYYSCDKKCNTNHKLYSCKGQGSVRVYK